MIYMNSTKEVVLFGGMNAYSNNFLNDVWVMDASSLPVISWYQLEDMRHNSTNSTNNYNGSINISSSSSSASLVLSPSSSDSSSNSSNPASSSGSGGGIGQSINVSSIPSARAFHGAVLFQESKILVWGGFSADAQPVSPNISVLDTQQWNWLPGTWQPKDGIIEGNHVIQFITYTSIAFGLAFFIGLATTAILMVGRMVQDRRQGAGGDLSSSKSSVAGAGSKTNLSSDEDDAGGGRMSSSANSTSNNNINKKQSRLLLNHAKSNNSINTVLSSSDTCSMVDMMMNRVDSSDTIHEVEEDDVLVRPSISSSSSNGGVFVDVDDTFGDAVPLVELSRAITTTSATKASPMMGSLRESRSARCLRKTHLFHDLESSSSSLATPITTSSASVNIFDDEAAIEYSSLDVAAASSSSSYAQQPHYINNNNFPHYSNDLIDISDGSSYVFPTTMITNSHQQQQSHGNSGTLRSNYSSIAFSTNSHENSFLIQAQHISNSPLDHPPPPLPLASSRPFTSSLAPLQRSHHHHQEDAFAYPQGTLLSRRSIVSDDGYVSLNSFSN